MRRSVWILFWVLRSVWSASMMSCCHPSKNNKQIISTALRRAITPSYRITHLGRAILPITYSPNHCGSNLLFWRALRIPPRPHGWALWPHMARSRWRNTSRAFPFGNMSCQVAQLIVRCRYESLPSNFSLTDNMLAGAFAGIAVRSRIPSRVGVCSEFHSLLNLRNTLLCIQSIYSRSVLHLYQLRERAPTRA